MFEDLSERLLAAAFGDVDEQQVVLAATRVGAHVGLRQLAVEQLHPALHLDPELAGGAADRQQLRRQGARDLERPGEGPTGGLVGVGGRVVLQDELQDPGLGELAERDARVLAPVARGLVLLVARPLVALEPDDGDRGVLGSVGRVP